MQSISKYIQIYFDTLRKMKATRVAIDLHSLASAVVFTKVYIFLFSLGHVIKFAYFWAYAVLVASDVNKFL